MRRTLVLICLLAACSRELPNAAPTPDDILADGIVTTAEFASAVGALQACVGESGAEVAIEYEQHEVPTYSVHGGGRGSSEGELEALFHRCRATHLGLVELAWVDDSVPTPQVEAAFFDDVVSCVEEFLDVELGTVNSEDGAGSSVVETAIAAEPQFYFVCFDHQLRGRS